MSDLRIILDFQMCFFWVVTYTLAFLGTVRYRYPLISLQTQAVIAPFEWIVLLNLFLKSARFNYAVAAYVLWALLDFAIIVLSFVTKKVPLKRKMMFLMLIILVTVALYDTVINHDAMFFFSYFNTIVGVLIWLGYVFNPCYPMRPISLAVFIAKLVADILGAIVYFGCGPVWIDCISIFLPCVDFVFILVYFKRKCCRTAVNLM